MSPELSRRERRAQVRRIRKELEAEARERLGRSPRGLRRELAALAALLAGAGVGQVITAQNAWAPTAVEYAFSNGQLSITGSNEPDVINVYCSEGKVNIQDRPTEIACSEITSIGVELGTGNDTMDLAGVSPDRFPALTDGHIFVVGELGADSIQGSAFADFLNGGNGADTMSAGPGNDSIGAGLTFSVFHEERGNDVLFGGLGNDWLSGGPGSDTMFGGQGEDSFADEGDSNTVEQDGPNGPNEHDPNETA